MSSATAAGIWSGRLEGMGRLLARLLFALAALVLLAMLLLTCADVVGRYLLHAPVNGKTELTRFMMAGLIAAALPAIGATGGHVSVDLFDSRFSRRAAAIRDLLTDGIAALALGVLSYWLAFRAERLQARGYVSDFLHLPLHPMAYFVAGMVAVAGLALLIKMTIDVHHIQRPDQRPPDRPTSL
ncbi:MAG: TRAP transporter small permease [Rhizobiales bacterium]|nr:TRAP transporter small permease [Hyphomicrobiales bacterium]